jgi:hypothetical protein
LVAVRHRIRYCLTSERADCVQTQPCCKERVPFLLQNVPAAPKAMAAAVVSLVVQVSAVSVCNPTTRNCIFLLDITRDSPQNSGNFSDGFRPRGPGQERSRVVPEGGETCSICRVGPCSALIRNARPVATGCVPAHPEQNSVATVARRSTMYPRRWALACGCVPARSAVTARRVAQLGVRGSRCNRAVRVRSLSPQQALPVFGSTIQLAQP